MGIEIGIGIGMGIGMEESPVVSGVVFFGETRIRPRTISWLAQWSYAYR